MSYRGRRRGRWWPRRSTAGHRSTWWSTWPGCSRSPTPTSSRWTSGTGLVAVNLTGTFLVCRQALPHLLASRGNIVNLASTAAHKGQPWASAYAASKGGVLAFTRALAVEYAGGRAPGQQHQPGRHRHPDHRRLPPPEGADIKLLSRVTPLGPFGTPEGIAAAIAYVASDEASHMNGADILIDGATLA